MHRKCRCLRRSVEVSITPKLSACVKKVPKTLVFSLPCTEFALIHEIHFHKLDRKVQSQEILK